MTVEDKLLEDYKTAMKENNALRKNTIQLMRAGILTARKNKQEDLTEDEMLDIIYKEQRKRQDVLDQFQKAKRLDLVEQTNKELFYISQYLPQPISEADLNDIIVSTIEELNATKKDFGAVMRKVKQECGNRANGKMISDLIKLKLN